MPLIIGIAIILVVVVVITYSQIILQKIRTRILVSRAHTLGFTQADRSAPPYSDIPGEFLLFSLGQPESRRDMIKGQYHGFQVTLYDYVYTKSLGKLLESFHQTVVEIEVKTADLPQFTCFPQTLKDTILLSVPTQEGRDSLLSTAGIRLPNHPNFRNKYKLMGTDWNALQNIFDNTDVIDALEAINRKPYEEVVCLEGFKQHMLIYIFNNQLGLRHMQIFLDKCIDLANLIAIPS